MWSKYTLITFRTQYFIDLLCVNYTPHNFTKKRKIERNGRYIHVAYQSYSQVTCMIQEPKLWQYSTHYVKATSHKQCRRQPWSTWARAPPPARRLPSLRANYSNIV